jgi:MFS family permease
MQNAALHWHVYLLTKSPLALGFVGLTRVIPVIVFSLFAGIVADRHDRRKVMLVSQILMAVFSAVLAAATFSGRESVAILYLLNGLLAAAGSFDNPARQALIPRLVPRNELSGALALNLSMLHAALIGGPALAGLVIAGSASAVRAPVEAGAVTAGTTALAWIYAVNALSFVSAIVAIAALHTSGRVETAGQAPEPPWQALRAGLRFVFTTPIIVWTTGLDFFATFFSGALSLLPVFADQVLGVGPAGYGWLVAAPALGALLGSLYTAWTPLPRRQGRVVLWSIAAYGLATIVYGLSRSYIVTLLALAFTGLADVVSTVIRQTLRQTLTPDALRGRMTSVNMIFFMGGPQLGEVEAGLVASLFASAAVGVRVSVVSGGIATILCAAIVAAATRVVRDFEPKAADSE